MELKGRGRTKRRRRETAEFGHPDYPDLIQVFFRSAARSAWSQDRHINRSRKSAAQQVHVLFNPTRRRRIAVFKNVDNLHRTRSIRANPLNR
jgi:hypothetical protein